MCGSESIKSLLSEKKVKQKVGIMHSLGWAEAYLYKCMVNVPGQNTKRYATTVIKLK